MKVAIYPGTFDPITNGHLDIINRAVGLFDKLIISVAQDVGKGKQLFSLNDRKLLVKKSLISFNNIEVDSFKGLMVDHALKHNAVAAIRGLRALSDFEFEFQMALMNRSINNNVSTLFLMPDAKYTHVSSSMIKEVASLGGSISKYVPSHVETALKLKYSSE